ncbi:MAG: GNAT family N-acetyltransferase [Dolichospermum sp.]|jgi:GNAT superfamily N-acetyltransferase|nr:GNAT family N-acetyltransferase [Dolichospermum sp.]
MNPYELPAGIEIQRDFEREEKEKLFNPGNLDTFYKILRNDKEAGYASYRLRDPNWYIDKFLIYEDNRRHKLGTHLLKYIAQKMLSEQIIPITIHPVDIEGFVPFLLKNKFQEKYGDYFLYPEYQ